MAGKSLKHWSVAPASFNEDDELTCWIDLKKRQAEALVAILQKDEVILLQQITAGWSRADSCAHFAMNIHQLEAKRLVLFEKINAASTLDAVRIGIYAGLV